MFEIVNGHTDTRTPAQVLSYKLTLWAFGSGELKMDVKIKRPNVELSAWLINYSSDISKGRVQRSMAITVNSCDEKFSEKARIFTVLPRFQTLLLLFLKNSYLSKYLITIFTNIVRQRVSANLLSLQ